MALKHGFEQSIVTDKILLELTDEDIDSMKSLDRKNYLLSKLLFLRKLIRRDGIRDRYKDSYEESVLIDARLKYRENALNWTLAELEDWG
jgi:hypothetical protein